MSYKELINNIKKEDLFCFNIIYGNETFLIDNAIKSVINKFVSKNLRELNFTKFEKIDDKENEFIETVATFPFMSDKKVIIVDDSDFLTSSGSINKSIEEKLIKLTKDNIDTTIVLFILKGKKPDNRKKLVKIIKENKAIYEIKKLDEGELTNYIVEGFKKNSVKITSSNASYIATNCGYLDYESTVDLYDVNNEIHKIASYTLDEGEVNREVIDALLIKSLDSNIFRLVDFICDGKKKEANKMLGNMLINGVAELFIMHMITRQVRMIYQYQILYKKGYSSSQVSDTMKIKPFIAKKLSSLSKNISMDKTEKILNTLLNIDRQIKTGLIDKTVGLEIICNSF
ncbi:DNA polymerase III subunit delta [Sedimentibacter sp. zth1]|uniref:DNA polymerase III subunit delta n=1 Tax=Sedimentibacter sp. zth1 TaxID=2816908 RepID=UPI001A9140A1|nr:DNA polymerase III subunit delta [Sedimentibacter sp. zth1]QSX07096.1 DNA polymerase III subunit delta [Sedimentibacter sp. zth1]